MIVPDSVAAALVDLRDKLGIRIPNWSRAIIARHNIHQRDRFLDILVEADGASKNSLENLRHPCPSQRTGQLLGNRCRGKITIGDYERISITPSRTYDGKGSGGKNWRDTLSMLVSRFLDIQKNLRAALRSAQEKR